MALESSTWWPQIPLLDGRPRWSELIEAGFGVVSLNKLAGGDLDLAVGVPGGRRGGGRRRPTVRSRYPGKDQVAASWGSYTVAEYSHCDLRPNRRPPQTPVRPSRSCVFNLLWWRPCYLDAAVPTYLRPSGFVPGAEVGRRVPRHSSACGDEEEEEPDCVFANISRVLCARIRDKVVFSFFFNVLYVRCKITAYE
jgi:hypothetical protein